MLLGDLDVIMSFKDSFPPSTSSQISSMNAKEMKDVILLAMVVLDGVRITWIGDCRC